MLLLLFGVVAAFAVLLIWDSTWIFWTLGAIYFFGGIGVAMDYRRPDRRFKSGYKNNEPDTSDPVRGVLLVSAGIALSTLGTASRKLVANTITLMTSIEAWWERHGGLVAAALLGLLVIYAVIARIGRATRAKPYDDKLTVASHTALDGLSPPTSQPMVGSSNDYILRILLYVAKADGQLRAPERAIIVDTFIAISGKSDLLRDDVDDFLSHMSVPTLHSFKLAISRLAKCEAGVQKIVLDAAEKILATQKTMHADEEVAIAYMHKRLATVRD